MGEIIDIPSYLAVTKEMYLAYKRTGIWPFPVVSGELEAEGKSVIHWKMTEREREMVHVQLNNFDKVGLYGY